jgi:hypothetical protein
MRPRKAVLALIYSPSRRQFLPVIDGSPSCAPGELLPDKLEHMMARRNILDKQGPATVSKLQKKCSERTKVSRDSRFSTPGLQKDSRSCRARSQFFNNTRTVSTSSSELRSPEPLALPTRLSNVTLSKYILLRVSACASDC